MVPMFSPKLYRVNKLPFKYIVQHNFDVEIEQEGNCAFTVKQQDNGYFRQIRRITGDTTGMYNPYILFVDCNGCKKHTEGLRELVLNGFRFNGRRYVYGERSASMTRQGILSFVDERLAPQLEEIVCCGLGIKETVLAKWYAYRGLMMSSCHNLEGWRPKIIVVPDRERVLKGQRIKYLVDVEVPFVDRNTGEDRVWKQKDVKEGVRDVTINLFDGCGIHHPAITDEVMDRLGELGDMKETRCTSLLIRAPFIKGMSHEMDYGRFFAERGVGFVQDIWGSWHDVRAGSVPMMIMTESMYKGYKYFRRDGTKADWERYWDAFEKYGHCIGIVRCNYGLEEEEVYRRGNYQILQDLDLEYRDFRSLADYSVEWAERIIEKDWVATACFLGLYADRNNPVSCYAKALARNPAMIDETSVKGYLVGLMKKYLDEMKCGKIFLKATSKFLAPDLVMLMEHIGGLELRGCLEDGEFWTRGMSGYEVGKEYLLERNPHIARSEHALLKMVSNEPIEQHVTHLTNVAMVNCKSLIAQRCNGGDFDGDSVLVIDNETMKKGVDRDVAVLIDIEDKIASLAEEGTPENKLQVVLRGMHSLIGESANCATTYHNKMPKTIEQKRKYESYIDILSVVSGKAIDAAKTGVLFHIPRHIAKYGKPVPMFMKWAGDYYAGKKKFLKSQSNMNRLSYDINKWHNGVRWQRAKKNFDYTVMLDETVDIDNEIAYAIETIFEKYCKERQELNSQKLAMSKKFGKFEYNWDEFFDRYRAMCGEVCPNPKMLANILVKLHYEKHRGRKKKFMWYMAGDGIAANIKQVDVLLPIRDEEHGEEEYLGKNYRMELPQKESVAERSGYDVEFEWIGNELEDFWVELDL